jgi:hypothetical protein
MPISRTGACPSFLEYVTRNALIAEAGKPTPEFAQLTQYNFHWIDIPSYQRGLVWDDEMFEELLNSSSVFLGNAILGSFPLPIPRGRFSNVPPAATDYEILIDGLQRFSIGTALLNILHAFVLADHPLKTNDAPYFAALSAQSAAWAPVYQHNDFELKNHRRNAVRESYVEFRQTLSTWIENEFNQGRAVDLAGKVQHLFLMRQIAPDIYHGFKSEYDVTSTFIGLNTVRVQLNIVDWLRSVIVDRGSNAGWSGASLAAVDNRFADVFTRGNAPEQELMPFAGIVLEALTDSRQERGKAVFPSWGHGSLVELEVNQFLDFVEQFKSPAANPYYLEIRQCGKIPFAGCISYYYRLYLANGGMPSFLAGGTAEDSELRAYLRANIRMLVAGRIGRTRPYSEKLLHDPVTMLQIADDIAVSATGSDLSGQVDPAWLTATLKNTDQRRAPRVFNACLLPAVSGGSSAFNPHTYGRKGSVYQVDHMIPESYIDEHPNDPGEPEARTLVNFAPVRRIANVAQSNLTCAGKLAAGGTYANEVMNDPDVHPYIQWLVSNQAKHGQFLDQMERLQPLANPPIAKERIDWLVQRLLPRL